MDSNQIVPNTGFAFSHDSGMENIISPFKPNLPSVDEEGDGNIRTRTSTASSRFSDQAQAKIRNISRSIKSVLRIRTNASNTTNSSDNSVNSYGSMPRTRQKPPAPKK
jgi:hypothetical protein